MTSVKMGNVGIATGKVWSEGLGGGFGGKAMVKGGFGFRVMLRVRLRHD